MALARAVALIVVAAALAAPASASGFAWSWNTTVTESGSSPVGDMSLTGHAIVGWKEATGGGAVARALPGQKFGAAETVTASGDGVEDVAVADNGDAFAAWADAAGVHVAIRPAGGSWAAAQTLTGATGPFALAAGADGDATVVAADPSGVRVHRRAAGESAFSAGQTAATVYSWPLLAGYVGDRVVVVGRVGDDIVAHTVEADGTVGAADLVEDTGGPPGMKLATDRAGAGAILVWPAYDGTSHMRAATAGADGVFGSGQKVSGDLAKGGLYPDGAIAPDGRTLVAWGDEDLDPVAMVAGASPSSPFGPTAVPSVRRRVDDLQIAFDSRGNATAVWSQIEAENGGWAHMDEAHRLAGRDEWCLGYGGHNIRVAPNTLRLHMDGNGRGFMSYLEAGTGNVWTQWYEAPSWTECPPPPEPAIGIGDPPAAPPSLPDGVKTPPAIGRVRRPVALTLPRVASVDRRGRLRLPVRCSGGGPVCTGRLVLKRGSAVWGGRSFAIAKGRKVLRVPLRPGARRALERRGRASATLELRLKGQPLKRTPIIFRRG